MKLENIQDVYELSHVQQGMLFHTLLSPESGVYFAQVVYALHGALNVQAFAQALQRLVDRHQILRTSFVWDELEKPLQLVHEEVKLPLEQHDWQHLSTEEQDERLEDFLRDDRARGFMLSEAPLMRTTLIRRAEDVYQFILSSHHILLDGWSISLLLKEFSSFYQAFCQGQDLQLENGRPYRDYIIWLQQQDLSEAESFWRRYLEGISAPTPLGMNRISGGLSGQRETGYSEQYFYLSTELTATLRSLAQRQRLTLNTILQGAWALLLSRYSGQEEVVFGFTSAGRPAALRGVESMIGLFINTLPIRIQVPSDGTLLLWLNKIQEQQLEVREYEHTPLVQIHGWSSVPRSMALFESIVEFENYPIDNLLKKSVAARNPGVQNSRIGGFGRTNYSLTMCLAEDEGALNATLGYKTERFDDATITRMLEHFQIILKAIADKPECHLSEINILTPAERLQLRAWNETGRDYPRDKCIHHLFEAQAERTPEAAAIVHDEAQLTYGELNRKANQLAHYLQGLGVGPEALVGICVQRSLDMVVALLGVLKTGGAYVALDPGYPAKRLQFMIEDAEVKVLITQRQIVEKIPAGDDAHLVLLDADCQLLASQSTANPNSTVRPENLAYVIYTSGSTGQPKGVAIEHRSSVSLLYWAREVFAPEDLAGVLATTSICFDCSVFELYAPLSWGGKAILAENVLQLPTLHAAGDVTLISTVPSTLFELLRIEGLPESVRTINLGGETSPDELVARLNQQKNVRQVLHLYGPTEDTTYTTFHLVEKNASGALPIGRPVANTVIYILDHHGSPVPPGMPGELYIGGSGLARGYLNRPDLTAEMFIPDILSAEPGQRIYKTGDLGLHLPDGNIKLLGRLDHQVKIRGYRIELGEIEAVIRSHPGVLESAVLVREDTPGDKKLVAYLVPDEEQQKSADDLYGFLKEHLPEYLIPSAFVSLDALPRMPNGKLDRGALPTPDSARLYLEKAFVAPRDNLEIQLTNLWEELFDTRPIGVRDNFFDLGGHSLLAVSLISRIQRSFGKRLPLFTLFEEPTVEHLADFLRR
jgi:amino acid adenylation domain-containing protein